MPHLLCEVIKLLFDNRVMSGLVELWQLSDKDPVHQDAKGSSVCYLPITVRGAALWWHVSKSAPAVTETRNIGIIL